MPDIRERGLSLAEAAEIMDVSKSRVVALRDEGRITKLANGRLCPISCEDAGNVLATKRGEAVHPLRFRVRPIEAQYEVHAIAEWAAAELGLTREQASRLADRCDAACMFVFARGGD